MNLLLSEAGKHSHAKYTKIINGKTFSYIGNEDEGQLIEEIVYNAIVDNTSLSFITNSVFQALVELPDKVLLITFNDNTDEHPGERTIEYLYSEFSEEEIMTYIKDHIVTENMFFVIENISKGLFVFSFEKENINFELKYEEIKAETLMSGKTKFKKFFNKNISVMLLLILTILTPILSYEPLKGFCITEPEMQLSKLDIEYKKILSQKMNLENEIEVLNKNYFAIQKEKDIFSNTVRVEEILNLSGFNKL